ncbi:MAG: hypothetical protein AAF533_23005 [Acidobacteriota bacterium]
MTTGTELALELRERSVKPSSLTCRDWETTDLVVVEAATPTLDLDEDQLVAAAGEPVDLDPGNPTTPPQERPAARHQHDGDERFGEETEVRARQDDHGVLSGKPRAESERGP